MHDGPLNDPLETQCGLGVHLFRADHLRRVVFDEIAQCSSQIVNIGSTGAQHFGRTGVVQ